MVTKVIFSAVGENMSLKLFLDRYFRTTILYIGVFGMLICSNNSFAQIPPLIYTSSGNFTVPDKVTSVQVQLWGAGGGGGFTGNSNNKGAGGGGGGAYLQVNSFSVSPGIISVTVGTGGNGQSATVTPGGNGGNSIFGSLISNGGFGANGETRGLGGAAAASGNIRNSGGNGASGPGTSNSAGGGGGAGAGPSGPGELGTVSVGGNGANGGGAGGNGGPDSGGVGLPGFQPGGGGGGEGRSAANGGNGGNGQVIVSWTCSNTLTSAVGTNNQPVCVSLPIIPIEYDIVGATGATFSGLPAGVTGSYAAGDVTISGTPSVSGTFNYTITPTGSCTSATATGTIVVSPNNTVGTISSSTFCIDSPLPGGVVQTTTGATGIGTPVWTPSNPGITASWASNQITFSGTPTTSGVYNYSIPITGGCGVVNATGSITINAVPAITSQITPGDTTCINTAFIQMSVGTGFGYTYQWYSNDTPDYTTPTLIAGATSNTYTPPSSTVGTAFYYVIVSSTSCTSVTSPVSEAYIVTPNNTAGTITSNTFCEGSPLGVVTQSTTDAIGINAAGATNIPPGLSISWAANQISFTGTPTTPGSYSYSIPLTGGCGVVNATGTITINAQAAITTPSLAGQTKCLNVAFSPISVGTGPGFTYQWFSNDTPDNTTPNLITGATGSSYTPLSNVAGTTYYYVEVTSASCGSTATSAASGAFLVNPLPAVTFTAQPVGPDACVDTDVTYATQSGQLNYVWTIPGTSGTDYSITSGGNGSNTLVIKWLTSGNKSVSVNYQDASGCGSTAAATSSTINVQKNTASVPSNPNPVFCINETITSFTHTTTIATGIGAPAGLPTGITASFASNTISISGTIGASVTPGNYTYSIPLTGGCGMVEATGTITVAPNNTVTAAPAISPVCINTALTSFIHTTTGATGIANNGVAGGNGLPAGVSATWAANTITISGTPTASGTFIYSIPLTGGCGTLAATGTITVTPNNTVTPAPVISPVCINTSLTSFTHTTTGATGIGAATGLPPGVTASFGANTITISGTPTSSAGSPYNYSIPLTGGCGTVVATGTITVTPNMAVNSATPNRTVCIDSPLTNINHNTTRATGIGAATGLPAGVTATWASNIITISGTPTVSGTFNYSIPLTGGCGTVNATGTISVTPNNTVTPAPVISPVCINTAISSFTHTTSGSNGIANNGVAGANGLPAGVSATRSGNTITISGTPTASGTFNYSIPLTGGCGIANATGTITVTPNNTASVPTSTPTLCINTGLTNITHTTTGATGISNAGVSGANGLPAGLSASWSGNVITISGTPTASGIFNYSIPMTGGCGLVNATGTITVTPVNTASAPSSSPTVCINTALTNITLATTGATGIGAATGLPAGVSANWAANTITISGTPTASGTFTYTIPLTGGCGIANATGAITVTPNNTVSAPSSTPTLCINTPLTNITHSSTGASGISNAGVSGANGLPAGLSAIWAGNVITISGTPTQAGTFNYSIPLTGGCANLFAEGTIIVNPATAITDEELDAQSICVGDLFSPISVTATGVGTLSYQWYSNTNSTTTGGTPVGTDSPSYTPSAASIGTLYYYVVVASGCSPNAVSNISGAFIVDPFTVITNHPDDTGDVECFGDGFDPISVVATGANLSYQWYSNNTESNLGGTAISGATLSTFTPLSTTEGSAYYYVVVTGNCGIETSDPSGEYIVTPPITTINLDPSTSDEVTCFGGSFPELEVGAIGETDPSFPNIIYQWYSNGTNSNTGGTAISGANSPKFTPPTSSVGTLYYYATAASKCGTVPTDVSGAFTVTPLTEIEVENLDAQVICDGETFDPISVDAIGTGTITYQWFRNTTANSTTGTPITGANTYSFTPPSDAVGTLFYYVEVTSECGADTSAVSGAMLVNPLPIPTFEVSPGALVCEQSGITYTTQSSKSNYIWTIPGNPGVDYTITAGGSGSSNESVTIEWLTTGSKTVAVSYTEPSTGCIASTTASSTTTVEPFATVGLPSSPKNFPSVCISSPTIAPFTQSTTGVTGIGVQTGLPPGITATFNSTTKNIEFSGTVVTGSATGIYSYNIILNGNCINGLKATGTIDVTPDYVLTSVSSVSATTIGGKATITINGNPSFLSNGIYEVEYQIAQGSGAFVNVGPVNVTVTNGRGSFSTIPISSVDDTYVVKILTIKKSTDVCKVTLLIPPTTYFGVCSAVFGGNSTFYVPANVYSITIEVYGGGGGGDNGGGGGGGYTIRQNITVTPGEPIAVYVGNGGLKGKDGGVSYVTRDSNIADQLTNSLVLANGGKGSTTGNAAGGTFDPRFSGSNGNNAAGSNGGKGGGPLGGSGGSGSGINGNPPGGGGGSWSGTNGVGGTGLVIISYSCPDANPEDCIKIIDDGTKTGYTVIEYTCDDIWTAPEGLAEFTVYVGSGGGGGGSGEGSGGGGSGALIVQTFTTSNPYGFPAGSTFPIVVGDGGAGAIGANNSGSNGESSSFKGTIDGNTIDIVVPGGGGGGSQNINPGSDGSSGGGGGASPLPFGSEGVGGNSVPISYSGSNVVVYQGNPGGRGDYEAQSGQDAIAGGGGGGLIPWKPNGNDGQNGKAAGAGQGEGGNGGDALVLLLGDSTRYYGAGGGGIGEYFNGAEKVGDGGFADDVLLGEEIKIGGDGNLDSARAVGGAGRDKTGSGGGAGYGAGGNGGSGVVYIVYYNVRILGVEYQSFTATYNLKNRSGELKWATAKEWENSHFEIERSVNDTRNWTKVGEVTGQGYSDVPAEYSFTDLNLPASGGNIYYRLKQVDFVGDFGYSLTRAIQVEALEGSTSWIAYPNPSAMRSSITVDLLDRSGYADESILIRISDARGIFESYSVSSPEEVSAVVNSSLDQSRPGLHILQLIWGNKSEQLKLIRN